MALQERTEPATPRKREELREEGKVARSADITSALVLIVALIVLKLAGPFVIGQMMELSKDTFSHLNSREVSVDSLSRLAAHYYGIFAVLCMPALVAAGAVGITGSVLQVGLKMSPKSLKPDLSRLDPTKGAARLLSWNALVELAKSTAKILVVGFFTWSVLKSQWPQITGLASLTPRALVFSVADMCWKLLIRGCIALLAIGAIDYVYQRLNFERSIRMTKQEIKEEYKRTEGDPAVKGRVRQRQREMARRRMIHAVAEADVVITNPTHVAVAIQYDSGKMSAPTVVAKGQRLLAAKIRSVAELNGIPIVHNPPVARLIYKTVDIGRQIPEELYQAVAEILAFVYETGLRKGIGKWR